MNSCSDSVKVEGRDALGVSTPSRLNQEMESSTCSNKEVERCVKHCEAH